LTYRELGNQAARAAAAFRHLGIDRNRAVALYLPNTLWHPIAFFGVLRTGAHVVHLSPLDAERELIHKLTDSGARTVVTVNLLGLDAKALRLAAAGHVDHVIVADDSVWGPIVPEAQVKDEPISLERLMAEAPTPSAWPPVSADDIALLQYTGA